MTLNEFLKKYMPQKLEKKLTKEEEIRQTVHQWFVDIRREFGIQENNSNSRKKC